MFGMSWKVVTEVNQVQAAEQDPRPVGPKERLERARAEYDRAKAALGKLRVAVFDGTIDAHAARRRKLDIEDDLERAGRELQAAMVETVNLPK
jgi:hypothetical protein